MKALKLDTGQTLLEDPELIIFDKDGTLIDVHFYWTAMIRMRTELLVQKYFKDTSDSQRSTRLIEAMGIDESTGKMKREGPVGIKPRSFIVQVVIQTLKEMGAAASVQEIETLFREVDEKTLSHIRDFVRLLPGVENFVRKAHDAGILLSIATSDRTNRAQETLNQFGLSPYFHSVLGGDQIQNSKPEPEAVERLLVKTKARREKTAVIGDHPVDILMGENAGLICNIGVLTGLGTREDFKDLPCHIIESFNQLKVENEHALHA